MDERAIDRTLRRPRRYWYEDGVGEIATGAIFLSIGTLFFAEARLPVPPSFSAFAMLAVVFLGVRLGRRLIALAKRRLTYPRTGEVTFERPRDARRRAARAIVLGAIFAAAIAALALGGLPLVWVPILDGIVIGAFFTYLAYTLGFRRFFVLAVASVALGVLASLVGEDDILGSAYYFGGLGVALLVSGGFTLRGYLRQPVLPAE